MEKLLSLLKQLSSIVKLLSPSLLLLLLKLTMMDNALMVLSRNSKLVSISVKQIIFT